MDPVRAYLGTHRIPTPEIGERYYPYSIDSGQVRVLRGGRRTRPVGTVYLYTLKLHRSRSADELIGRMLASIKEVSSLRRDDVLRIRAGAVVRDGSILLLPSAYDPRLPALVALLVRGGLAYLSDELVHVDPVLRRVSAPDLPILIDPRHLASFPGISREVAATRRAKRDGDLRFAVSADELGGRRAGPGAVGRVVFPRFEAGGPTRLEPISRSEAAFELAKAGLNVHVWGERAILLAEQLMADARIERMHVGRLEDAAELLLSSGEA